MYSALSCIKWFQWTDCKLDEDVLKKIKKIAESNVGSKGLNIAFSYSFIDHHANIEGLHDLLGNIQNIKLRGSYLHSKGAYMYLLNIASAIDCQYSSPQELIADYLAAVLCYSTQSMASYFESLLPSYSVAVKNSFRNVLCMSVFNISHNFINSQVATEIANILSFSSNLQAFCAKDSNLLTENTITIVKGLQSSSILTVFNISNNNICEKAAKDISTILFHHRNLQQLYLEGNNFKTVGIIEIARSLQNTSTLTVFSIRNNSIGEEAADDIATVLSQH